MKIYTRTGDNGLTSLFGGKRVSKSDPLVESYGALDELTSFIGLAINKLKNKEDKKFLIEIQKDLYEIMAILAGVKKNKIDLKNRVLVFENKIDKITRRLTPLNKFVLPSGTELSSWFHILRTICRRAERKIVALKTGSWKLEIVRYINRLSDLFFTFSRKYSKGNEVII